MWTETRQENQSVAEKQVWSWRFCWLLVIWLVSWSVGSLVADNLPDFWNVKCQYIQCHFQLSVAHYNCRVFWIEQFAFLNASLQSKQNLKLKVHENLLWWVGGRYPARWQRVAFAYFFHFPFFISLSLALLLSLSLSLSLSLVLSYLNLKT
jgi:hypothetical protein